MSQNYTRARLEASLSREMQPGAGHSCRSLSAIGMIAFGKMNI
jgi:hypothetical protein